MSKKNMTVLLQMALAQKNARKPTYRKPARPPGKNDAANHALRTLAGVKTDTEEN